MNGNRPMRWLVSLFVIAMVFAGVAHAQKSESAQQQAQRQQTQPGNSAPVWREVRGGEITNQTTQVRGIETAVLVQSGGETWRQTRLVFTYYGGWVLGIVPLLIALFYLRKGAIKLKEKPSGRTVRRFSTWQRTVHWTVAISFCLLALSGIIMMFGKYVLMPVFGRTLFSWLAILSKNLHNVIGPVFAVAMVLMIVTYMKDNLPRTYDVKWFAKAGGLFSGAHVPSGRYNAGEKSWFWFGVCALGLIVSITGFILDFPNFEQGRAVMQQANAIHAVAAVVFIALSLGHIYMGTLGVEGAYQSMRRGDVDETWAKEHHEYWYQEVIHSQAPMAGVAHGTMAAESMTEGNKP